MKLCGALYTTVSVGKEEEARWSSMFNVVRWLWNLCLGNSYGALEGIASI